MVQCFIFYKLNVPFFFSISNKEGFWPGKSKSEKKKKSIWPVAANQIDAQVSALCCQDQLLSAGPHVSSTSCENAADRVNPADHEMLMRSLLWAAGSS